MIHAESLGEQLVLGVDHVVVRVLREPRVHSVAWFARPSMSDAVGEHDEIVGGIEQLPRTEQLTAERLAQESASRPGSAMQYQHGVPHQTRSVAARLAERDVVDAKVLERLAAREPEVVNRVVLARGRPTPLCLGGYSDQIREGGERDQSTDGGGGRHGFTWWIFVLRR